MLLVLLLVVGSEEAAVNIIEGLKLALEVMTPHRSAAVTTFRKNVAVAAEGLIGFTSGLNKRSG